MSRVRDDFVAGRAFPLDRFQHEALDALDAGAGVLVSAPTGAGKTVVADYAVRRALAEGTKVFYTTPIKALSNQKHRDLVADLGAERVGLLTGDNAIRGDAPVVVMTTEVLRNMIFARSPTLVGLAYVVLDEVHYLQDRDRGAVWEEVIVHLPEHVRLVCLSATVANAGELGDWLRTVRGRTEVILETRRPVELTQHYATSERHRDGVRLLPILTDGRPNRDGGAFDAPRRARRGRFRRPWHSELVEDLDERRMLPAIVFVFSRDGCEEAVARVRRQVGRLTDAEERRAIRQIAEAHTEALDDDDLRVLGYGAWLDALEAGVAAHHAGIVPPMKEAVEAAFAEGLVKVVFATETLALGVNLPARTVVVEKLTKFTGERHEHLTPGEYTQLTGRAGRRGIDDHGHAVVCWSPWTPFAEVATLAAAPPAPLRSAFRPTYNTAANLVRRYDPEEAHRLLNLSFAQFHADRDVVALERDLERRRARLAASRRDGPARPDPAAADAQETAIRRLERRIGRRGTSLARHLDRVLEILEAWGYIERWSLTRAGELLAGLSTEADLLLAEAVRNGTLATLAPAELGALVSCFTYRHRGRGTSEPPRGSLAAPFAAVEELSHDLAALERDQSLPETRALDPGFVAPLRAWIDGAPLARIVDDELSPGDFVRHVKQTVDLLHQIADLGIEPVSAQARTAARACLRDLVEASTVVRT